MKDRLSSARSDVEDGAVPVFDVTLARDLRSRKMASADDLRVDRFGLLQSREMFLWDDEHVCGRLRADVFESENMFVFVNFLRGNLAPDDSAKKAFGIAHAFDTWRKDNTARRSCQPSTTAR